MTNRSSRTGKSRSSVWFKAGLLFVLAAGAASLYTPYPAMLVRAWRSMPAAPAQSTPEPAPVAQQDPPAETPREPAAPPTPERPVLEGAPVAWTPDASFRGVSLNLPPFPPALPERVPEGNFQHINDITRGFHLKSNVNCTVGTTATQDRKRKDAYRVQISMELLHPHAANGKELLLANPHLNKVFRNYDALMSNAKVSPWFASLYQHKLNRIRKDAATLTNLLDRHNYYDTDTILEIRAPGTGRRVLWIQADMDVVSDGSDGDRLPSMPEYICKSDNYQPTTSYRWKKRNKKQPNPLLPRWKAHKAHLEETRASKDQIQHAGNVIVELTNYSFLIAEYDPFIVIPLTFKEARNDRDTSFRPQPGDYAVVVVGSKVYPAIVGDYGPKHKTGEASLRLCKAVNPKSSVNCRAVSDLGVSYIIFPGTKDPENGPIDYPHLNARCRELVEEMGGLGEDAVFVEMQDLLPVPPAAE